MSRNGSAPQLGSSSAGDLPTFHPAVAVGALALGVLFMFASALLVGRLGVGYRALLAMGSLGLALPSVALLVARPAFADAALGTPRSPSGRLVGLAALLGGALWVGSIGLMEMQSLVVPPTPAYLELFRRIHAALAPSGPADALVSLLVIAALPGLCEELVMRGVVLPSLARAAGDWPGIVLSALLFALIHVDAYRFLFTLTIGLAFGWVRVRTGSLWPSVIAHLTLNALTFAVAPLVDDPTRPYTPQPVLGIATLVVGTAATLPLLRVLRDARTAAAGRS